MQAHAFTHGCAHATRTKLEEMRERCEQGMMKIMVKAAIWHEEKRQREDKAEGGARR